MELRHVKDKGSFSYPVCPLNRGRCINWKGFHDDDHQYCAWSFEGECAVFDFLTSVPHALLGDEPIALEVRVADIAAGRIDRLLEDFYSKMEEAWGLHMRYKTTDDEYRELKEEIISGYRDRVIEEVVHGAVRQSGR